MSGYLDRLEQQLVDAARADSPERKRRAARHRTIPVSAAAAAAALLVASAVALAVTGTFSTGSAVRPPVRPVASAGAGVAARGTRLLPMRVADPAGGLPWGMRLVHTTRDLVCVQVGRIDGSQLGVLGQDGAFDDDGRFHPVAPDVVGYHRSTTEVSSCLPPGQTTSQEADIPQNGVFGARNSKAIPKRDRRQISYGLLGPNAVSVSYTAEGHEQTLPVARGSGAYLLVLPSPPKGSFETGGGAVSTTRFVTPQGAISSITYRVHGRLCSESRPTSEASSAPQCPRPLVAQLPGAPRRLHRRIAVRLTASGTAVVTFKAPRAVTSALSGYTVEVSAPCHEGTDGIPVERDVRAGEVVHVEIPGAFVNACGHTVTMRVVYEHERERFPLGEDDLIVGETVVTRAER
jgi:hypothetical protein